MNPANGIPYPTHRNSDALEAYDSFRRSRCLFFCLLLAGLVITQGSFWIVTLGNLDPAVSPAPAEATAPSSPLTPAPSLGGAHTRIVSTVGQTAHKASAGHLRPASPNGHCWPIGRARGWVLLSRTGLPTWGPRGSPRSKQPGLFLVLYAEPWTTCRPRA